MRASPAPSLSRTPAIYREEPEPSSKWTAPGEEGQIRQKALQAFEQASIRRDALNAHGAITDNLLNF